MHIDEEKVFQEYMMSPHMVNKIITNHKISKVYKYLYVMIRVSTLGPNYTRTFGEVFGPFIRKCYNF